MAMSIWFALLERYDIRSTFDETITWIWLRYSKSTSSKQAEPISPEEKAMLVKSAIWYTYYK